jgi:two-component system sensor histidine kinase HydH
LEWEHLAKLGQVSAGLAHEIRNPLATIKGFAQLAAERTDERGAELLAPVVSETLRLERLVNDLLLYGRPSVPSKRDVFWPAVATELEQHCLSAASDVRLRLDRAPIRFTSDPDLLHRILLNGLRNAIDAVRNEPSPEISIDIEVERTALIITIADDGPGIPKDVATKLFQPFFSTKAFGAGLGLAISAQTAKVLSGTVELRNRSLRGAKFTLRLANANPVPEKVIGTIHAEHPGS